MEGRVPGGRKKSLSGDELSADEGEDSSAGARQIPSGCQSLPRLSEPLQVAAVPATDKTTTPHDTRKKKKSRSPSFRKFGTLVHKVVQQVSTLHSPSTPPSGSSATKREAEQRLPAQATKETTADHPLPDSSPQSQHIPDKHRTPGVVGIRNHGNTCFLNAVLQCLSNTDLLVEYFVLDQYKNDIKRNNKQNAKKYGTKGELTEHLALLLKSLWTCKYTPEVSSEFKSVVGKYGSQYRGYAQHDAQEFLMWLLDKVHEDLNIATKKKYRANKSSHGRSDEAVAQEALANHARCNNSAVYDLFQALYRSSLTCPNCRRQSNTFDPFLSVSLPIPQKTRRPVYVTVVYYDAQPRQMRIGLLMNQCDTVRELRRTLATDTKIPETQLILTEIYFDGFHRTFHDSQLLTDIHETDNIYAIETPPPMVTSTSETEHINVVVLNKQGIGDHGRRFGSVHVLRTSRDKSFLDLQNDFLHCMTHMLRQDGIVSQRFVQSSMRKLGALFRMRVVDGLAGMCYLPHDVELPLYMPTVDRALSLCVPGGGPVHLKLMLEWDQHTKQCMIQSGDEVTEEHESVQQVKLAHQQPLLGTLDECFQLYTQEERLGADDAWLCPSCRKRQQGTIKALCLWSLPEIFVIHLKRFRQDTVRRTKLNTLITFPVSGLDMTHHICRQQYQPHHSNNKQHGWWSPWRPHKKQTTTADYFTYDLFAVCNHYGNMQGGHYTAFCKNPADRQWYLFDDTKVTPINEEDIVTRAAYLLFYQRRSQLHRRPSDPSHWIHKLNQVSVKTMRTPPVSKSHEDLLDGGDGEEEKDPVREAASPTSPRPASGSGSKACATMQSSKHTSPTTSSSYTLPANLQRTASTSRASLDSTGVPLITKSATTTSLASTSNKITSPAASPRQPSSCRSSPANVRHGTSQTGVIRQRSRETIIDEESLSDRDGGSTFSTPVHKSTPTAMSLPYYYKTRSTPQHKSSNPQLTRSLTSPEVTSNTTPVTTLRRLPKVDNASPKTVTRRMGEGDKKKDLQQWNYQCSKYFLQESSV